jgi:hypothetical protein
MVNVAVMGNKKGTGRTPMTTTLSYLGLITDRFFERHMRRAAKKICAGSQLFPGA